LITGVTINFVSALSSSSGNVQNTKQILSEGILGSEEGTHGRTNLKKPQE
jgi:hypothetical protein